MSSQCVKSAICCAQTSSVGCKLFKEDIGKEKENIITFSSSLENKDNRQFLYGRMIAGDSSAGWPGVFRCTDFLGLSGDVFQDAFTLNVENSNKSGSDHLNARHLCSDVIFYGECNLELASWKDLCEEYEVDMNGARQHISNIIKSLINHKPYSLLSSRNAGGYSVEFIHMSTTDSDYSIMDYMVANRNRTIKEAIMNLINGYNSQGFCSDPKILWSKYNLDLDGIFVGLSNVDQFSNKCIMETFGE
jgi:hypothetical protein